MKTFYIDGIVGIHSTSEGLSKFLQKANGEPVLLYVDSGGGYVDEALSMYAKLLDYAGTVTIYALYAASAAQFLTIIPGAKVYSRKTSYMMIHNVWGISIGDYRDMQKTADIFSGLSDMIAVAISRRLNITPKQVRKLMDNETWYFSDEIKNSGLSDVILLDDEKMDGVEPKENNSSDYSDWFSMLGSDTSNADGKRKYNLTSDYIKNTRNKFSVEAVAALIPALSKKNNAQNTEVLMTLDELLQQNPQASVEYQARLADEKKKLLQNVSQIVALLPDGKLDTVALNAIANGHDVATYAVARVKAENEKRQANAADTTITTGFGVPPSSVPPTVDTTKAENKKEPVSRESKAQLDKLLKPEGAK